MVESIKLEWLALVSIYCAIYYILLTITYFNGILRSRSLDFKGTFNNFGYLHVYSLHLQNKVSGQAVSLRHIINRSLHVTSSPPALISFIFLVLFSVEINSILPPNNA